MNFYAGDVVESQVSRHEDGLRPGNRGTVSDVIGNEIYVDFAAPFRTIRMSVEELILIMAGLDSRNARIAPPSGLAGQQLDVTLQILLAAVNDLNTLQTSNIVTTSALAARVAALEKRLKP